MVLLLLLLLVLAAAVRSEVETLLLLLLLLLVIVSLFGRNISSCAVNEVYEPFLGDELTCFVREAHFFFPATSCFLIDSERRAKDPSTTKGSVIAKSRDD